MALTLWMALMIMKFPLLLEALLFFCHFCWLVYLKVVMELQIAGLLSLGLVYGHLNWTRVAASHPV